MVTLPMRSLFSGAKAWPVKSYSGRLTLLRPGEGCVGGRPYFTRSLCRSSEESEKLTWTRFLENRREKRRYFWKRASKKFGDYEIVSSAKTSPMRSVPQGIPVPPYIANGTGVEESPPTAEVKTEDQIRRMRAAGGLARKTLLEVRDAIQAGVTTDELDVVAHEYIIQNGAYPSPLGYYGYPKSICTSVNNVACHGIPDLRPLKDGELITVDVTVFLDGVHGDCAETFVVGGVSRLDKEGKHLFAIARKCLEEGIKVVRPGVEIGKIGEKVERTALENGLNVIPAFGGHGIGSYFHGKPDVLHFWNKDRTEMVPGMTFTIEPCITQGSREIMILDDGWTAVTHDCARTAQFEHTLLVTPNGVDILTGDQV